MNTKRMAIGSIAGLIILYITGVVFWEMLFADFFAANGGSAQGLNRDEPILWAVLVGTLLYAVLITTTVEAGSGTSVMDGAKTGAIVGLLLWGTADFILYGYTNMSTLTGTIADTILEAVRGGIAGAVIALSLNRTGD